MYHLIVIADLMVMADFPSRFPTNVTITAR